VGDAPARRELEARDDDPRGARRARRLEELRDEPPEEAMRNMMTLRGVGPWTANVMAMQALGYADAVLVGDSGAPASGRGAAQAAAPYVARLASVSRAAASGDPSPDVLLTGREFSRVSELVENPPAPSGRLRRLLGRGTA